MYGLLFYMLITHIYAFLVLVGEGRREIWKCSRIWKQQKTDITARLCTSLEDDETVQGDLEKELLEYESINFLTISYTLEEIILIQLIKIWQGILWDQVLSVRMG